MHVGDVNLEWSCRFLRTAFEPDDWVALFLKSYDTGRVAQRIGSLRWALSDQCQAWLALSNARRFNVYVSVNAIGTGRRARTREAIAFIRHVFLEADRDGAQVLSSIQRRSDLPPPSYILHSSPDRLHLFWRVTGFDHNYVERLQKRLALELATDTAATPVTQTTRVPGFLNHKRPESHMVAIEYRDSQHRFGPCDFPVLQPEQPRVFAPPLLRQQTGVARVERALRYLSEIPPAVTGEHGDLHTFRVCCRLVRGFALEDEQALSLLLEWNQRCRPPWTTAELLDKLRRAFRYGREPVGGLL